MLNDDLPELQTIWLDFAPAFHSAARLNLVVDGAIRLASLGTSGIERTVALPPGAFVPLARLIAILPQHKAEQLQRGRDGMRVRINWSSLAGQGALTVYTTDEPPDSLPREIIGCALQIARHCFDDGQSITLLAGVERYLR